MRLTKARVQGYRSIIDTGYFDVEDRKTILVGPNEAGKTAILQALQKLNPPEGVQLFDPLRVLVHAMMRISRTEISISKSLLLLRGILLLRMLTNRNYQKRIIVSYMFLGGVWTIQYGID